MFVSLRKYPYNIKRDSSGLLFFARLSPFTVAQEEKPTIQTHHGVM